VACKFENNVTLGNYWCDVINVDPVGTHPDIDMYWMPLQCQQCEDSPCVGACPTGAAYRDPDNNVVLIDKSTCVGNKACLTACPYSDDQGATRPSVRWFNEAEGVTEKCTLCNHITSTSDGIEDTKDSANVDHAVPPCVHNCSTKARHFGDLDDPNSGASVALAAAAANGQKQYSLATAGQPGAASTVYLMSDSTAAWRGWGNKVVTHALD